MPTHVGLQVIPIDVVMGHPVYAAAAPDSDEWKDDAEPALNVFWLLLLLGMFFCPPLWLCGIFGLFSSKQDERVAGCFNAIALISFILLLVLVFAFTIYV